MELNGRKWGAIVMLMGEYNHTIDAKGRLIVPAKFREVLGDEFVVTKGLDNCLFVYPNDDLKKSYRHYHLPIRMQDSLQDSFLQVQQA